MRALVIKYIAVKAQTGWHFKRAQAERLGLGA